MAVRIEVIVDNGDHGTTIHVDVPQPALNAVLFDFNPSSDGRVTALKALYAGAIAQLNNVRREAVEDPAKGRTASYAITQTEIAQMCAVKALFAK